MDKIKIGKIVGTHGLKGEVKIRSSSDFSEERFKKGNFLIVRYQENDIELEIVSSRVHKSNYLISFKDNQDINLVEKFIGSFVYGFKDKELLDDDEYFYDDLIGLEVSSTDGKMIGAVTSIYDNGRHDILNIDHNGKNVAIPYVDAFIKSVDMDNKIITVELIKGLIDED
ncbi:MAG: ribosome maturation factor RimM [Thomasclavelia sp.]|uniref:ribosome maturation factor RimM n=1 Tax=Thomasclavelia sp. TaxID=3025757 RepID=UPI00399F3CB1